MDDKRTINRQHEEETGQLEGDVCRRNGCEGIIEELPVENCSCHICPPCGSCTAAREYCPDCGWTAEDDVTYFNDYVVRSTSYDKPYVTWAPRPLDHTKIDYRSKGHTHFSMIKEGVFPFGTTHAQVLEKVKGTFGGRFLTFIDATETVPGRFTYVAYTD